MQFSPGTSVECRSNVMSGLSGYLQKISGSRRVAAKLCESAAEDAKAYEQLKALANEHDAARSDRFLKLDDKLRSLTSRLLPRVILRSEPFSLPDEKIVFKTEAKGRPYLAPQPGSDDVFDFNCTHDHDYVCCGFLIGPFLSSNASARIGVDVMKLVNPFPDCSPAEMLNTLRDQLDEAEVRDVEALPTDEQMERMLRYWTHKEALVKATGEGVGAGLERYRVTFGEQTILHEDGAERWDWRFHEMVLQGHLLVLALHLPGFSTDQKPDTKPNLLAYDMQEFIDVVKGRTV